PRLEGQILPAPLRRGGPPLWIGGTSDRVIGVAARLADAWDGWGLAGGGVGGKEKLLDGLSKSGSGERDDPRATGDATGGGIVLIAEDEVEAERLLAERISRGRPAPAFAGSAGRAVEWLASLRQAGAAWAVLLLAGSTDRLALVAEQVLPRLAP